MSTEIKERKRRSTVRHHDVVFGAIDERLLIIELIASMDTCKEMGFDPNLARLRELINELKRSISKEEE